MCIVSNIGDGYQDLFNDRWPTIPTPNKPTSPPVQWITSPDLSKYVTKEEFADLKKEVEALKILLCNAHEFDKQTDQKNCESPDKLALIRWLATALGVDLSDLKLNE